MGGLFPPECLEDKVSITFPASAFATSGTPQLCGGAAKAIYETLKSIDWLFGTEDLPTKWDQQKLDDFQNIIYTQINHSQCVRRFPYSLESLLIYGFW
ncbi:hypothetical protein DPEC_G00275720 [Dallia pectoralis]|uniref:Uncharacterized protein n=1 Tax=Dallia pectoralis TaxID=75939 RepID=A0ACC2FLD4_DALPE|nr:hypothetical protein DPEC_G00275720 [Dallia pectoralis]